MLCCDNLILLEITSSGTFLLRTPLQHQTEVICNHGGKGLTALELFVIKEEIITRFCRELLCSIRRDKRINLFVFLV